MPFSFLGAYAVQSSSWFLTSLRPLLSRLAKEYGLELIYNKKFHQVYEEASQELDFNQLLYRMNVISEEGHLSEDEWEAASMCYFCAVILEYVDMEGCWWIL